MCFDERNTDRRSLPLARRRRLARTRVRRRSNRALALSDMGLLLLAFLTPHRFGRVFDPLAFVGFGRTIAADFGGDLAYALAVGAADLDHGRPLAGDLYVFGDREGDVVAVAELQVQDIALHRRAVADPVDLEPDGKALRDADDHVVDQGAGG